jgi:hypothetical protein
MSLSGKPGGLALVTGLLLAATVSAASIGTTITYQGQLKQSGISVTGPADMVFRLFDDPTAGGQVGATLTFDGAGGNPAPVAVAAGLFKVDLDFGAAAFNGQERYLQIDVRYPAGGGAYTTLNPRQRITAAPYALFSLSTAGGNTLDQAYRQGGPGAGRVINADGGAVEIAGAGGLTVNSQLYVNPGLNFVGVGRNTRVTTAEIFGLGANTSGFGGMYIDTTGASGQPFYGYATGGSQKAYHYFDGASSTWRLTLGGATRVLVTSGGDVGIGTANDTPTARLEVRATATDGIYGRSTAAFSYGVHGYGTSAGVYGEAGTSDGAGVLGKNNTTGGTGVEGSSSANGGAGVSGYANFGTGVYGQTADGYGIYGSNAGGSGYAGYFNGRVHVAGTLSKSGGSFKIDHPQDPKNKFLSHSFVESPERMNVYNGIVALDGDGKATVSLPSWFQALNKDYRYQLTAIGGPGPNLYIAREIENGTFAIAGGTAGLKVSWQVTGVRQDAWAKANPLLVEEDKPEGERGHYLNPEVFPADAPAAPAN